MSDELAFERLYQLRDQNNKWFVKAWRRLRELDPEFWRQHQMAVSRIDREITELMEGLCD